MRILVTGANGQLGIDAVRIFKELGHEVFGYGRESLDITNENQCREKILEHKPDVVVHCAAYTAVDMAETDVESAYLVNAAGTRNMAVQAENIGAKFVYISTDYVFDGNSELPYKEYDFTDPSTIYGKSKLAGEQLVQSLSSRYFIVRTSWVYGKHGSNFVGTMLKIGKSKSEITVVNDQKGSPTYTVDLVFFLEKLIETEKYGIYHASNSGECTWYEFAKTIFEYQGIDVNVIPCTTDQFPRPARRPKNSVLNNMQLRINGFKELRSWREALSDYLGIDY